MNTPDPRADARNRAKLRLRRMTIGTTAFGIAATGILGMTAAFANDGSSATVGTTALVVTADTGTATPSTSRSSSSSTSTAPSVTSTSGSAHASTGGS